MELQKKFCHNCGKSIPVGAKFCPFCGTSQASIDERPPEAAPEPQAPRVPNRLKPRRPAQAETFIPFNPEEDEDGEAIAADRVGSIQDLDIRLEALDIDLRVPQQAKETVGSLFNQGKAMGQPLTPEPPRPPGAPLDSKTAMQMFQQEAGTLRKN